MERPLATETGTLAGFDFTAHMRRLCAALVERLPELQHIELQRVAIGFRRSRRRVPSGVQATLTPLRFAGGQRSKTVGGRRFVIEPVEDERGREMLYLLNFFLPRFFESPFEERLVTVVHELWHISPAFDGDLRRLHGRCYAHSRSRQAYDDEMLSLVRRWLEAGPPPEAFEFLRLDLRQLEARGPIWGLRFPVPKLRRVS